MFTFLIVCIAGGFIGCFLRAGALVVASLIFLAYCVVSSVLSEPDAISAVVVSFAMLATLQAGYICGVAISTFGKKVLKTATRHHHLRHRLNSLPRSLHEQGTA